MAIEDIRDILKVEQVLMENSARQNPLTYDGVCRLLRFYCGWNPKTEEKIGASIASGIPELKDVKVRVRGCRNVKISFRMPDGCIQEYRYP